MNKYQQIKYYYIPIAFVPMTFVPMTECLLEQQHSRDNKQQDKEQQQDNKDQQHIQDGKENSPQKFIFGEQIETDFREYTQIVWDKNEVAYVNIPLYPGLFKTWNKNDIAKSVELKPISLKQQKQLKKQDLSNQPLPPGPVLLNHPYSLGLISSDSRVFLPPGLSLNYPNGKFPRNYFEQDKSLCRESF